MATTSQVPGQDPVDLTNCDREPIHILGRIQDFGWLLAVSSDWMIVHASENVAGCFDREAADIIGLPAAEILGYQTLDRIRKGLSGLYGTDSVERIFGVEVASKPDTRLDVAVHFSGSNIVLEFEPANFDVDSQYTSQVRLMIERLRQSTDVDSLCNTAAKFVKSLTGFDRVMVYRFAPDDSGEVIAEAAEPGIGTFLGLHYPASDIPRQARELYRRNLLRIISDVNGRTVPVIPGISPEGRPLDMSMCGLRAVSPIHIEYLQNMGVEASMSISILRRGELWGLFSCHHYSPLVLSYDVRTAAELFAEMFAFLLDQQLGDRARAQSAATQALHNKLMADLAEGSTVRDSFEPLATALASLIPCSGIAGWVEGSFVKRGQVPEKDEFMQLVRFLNTTAPGQIYSTNALPSVFAAAANFSSRPAGLMALPVSRAPRDYIVLFRNEIAKTIKWAGDPSKPVEYGPNGARLTPRKSFEAWQETVRGQSAPWEEGDLDAAESLRITMLEVVLRISDAANRDRDRAQQQQELLIAELNHRVRNILNLIRGLVSQSTTGNGSIEEFVDVIGGRIQALARAHDQITDKKWSSASIIEMIQAETEAYLGGTAERVEITGPNPFIEPSAYTTLSLVIHELVTNSAKYGALSDRRGRVAIALTSEPDGSLTIAWREVDGPVVRPPTRRGFGSIIIEQSIPFELQGKADIRFVPTGFEADFVIPALHIERVEGGNAAQSERDDETAVEPTKISGNVLLVEDNMLIALDSEDFLEEMGASKVFLAATVAKAMQVIDSEDIVMAILDVNLGSETSEPVADRLSQADIPFAFATGYGEISSYTEKHPQAPLLQKPFSAENLREAVAGMFARNR
ncbi:HWE histidine kinase domain-containing protein [Microbaculum marinum]|uniref:histidine kinase n=1 Tax=Microbaculum marinum TaxID=1764581 RepID=A0AAW9S435_9HYPH